MSQSMKIKLNKALFNTEMKKLNTVFQDKKITKGFLNIYYDRLNYVTNEEFSSAANQILDQNKWFPSIKDLKGCLPPMKFYINED